eukprot:s6968_g1.t1
MVLRDLDRHRFNPHLLLELKPGDEAEYFDLACSDWSRARVLEPARAGCIRLSEQDTSEVGLVEPGELVRVLLDGDLRLVRGEFLVDLASGGDSLFPGGRKPNWLSRSPGVRRWSRWQKFKGRLEAPLLIDRLTLGYRLREPPLGSPGASGSLQVSAGQARGPAAGEAILVFRRLHDSALSHVHFLFGHDCTRTLVLDEPTPPEMLQDRQDKVVGVFHEVTGQLERIKVAEWRHHDEASAKEHPVLNANSTPYHRRGWCIAEREWSNARSQSSQAPMLPARFFRKAEAGAGLRNSRTLQAVLPMDQILH